MDIILKSNQCKKVGNKYCQVEEEENGKFRLYTYKEEFNEDTKLIYDKKELAWGDLVRIIKCFERLAGDFRKDILLGEEFVYYLFDKKLKRRNLYNGKEESVIDYSIDYSMDYFTIINNEIYFSEVEECNIKKADLNGKINGFEKNIYRAGGELGRLNDILFVHNEQLEEIVFYNTKDQYRGYNRFPHGEVENVCADEEYYYYVYNKIIYRIEKEWYNNRTVEQSVLNFLEEFEINLNENVIKIGKMDVTADFIFVTLYDSGKDKEKIFNESLYRINKDGSGIKRIYNGCIEELMVYRNKVFFIDANKEWSLFSMDLNGGNLQMIEEGECNAFDLSGDKIAIVKMKRCEKIIELEKEFKKVLIHRAIGDKTGENDEVMEIIYDQLSKCIEELDILNKDIVYKTKLKIIG